MKVTQEDIITYAESIKDFAPEYTPMKCTSLLQFFRLRGRTSVITSENYEPIPDLHYTVKDTKEEKYYFKEYRGYPLDELFFYRPSLTFSGDDAAVDTLRRYVENGILWILLTPEQKSDLKDMLCRVWKVQLKGELNASDPKALNSFYKIYLELAYNMLMYEDYKTFGSRLTGYKTVCRMNEQTIGELWLKAASNQKNIS